jgi:hypothetical protein
MFFWFQICWEKNGKSSANSRENIINKTLAQKLGSKI